MSGTFKTLFGVWDPGDDETPGEWLRDFQSGAILAFASKRKACAFAASNWGFPSYTAAKRAGWCEVRPLTK